MLKHLYFNIKELIIFLFLLSGVIYSIFGRSAERYFFALFVFVFLFNALNLKFRLKTKNLFDILYTLFIITFLIDYFIFKSFVALLYGFAMEISYFSIRRCLFQVFDRNLYSRYFKFIIYVIIFYVIYCFIRYGIRFTNYNGSFSNPNAYGLLVFEISVIALVLIDNNFLRNNQKNLNYLFLYCIGLFLVFISGCRTALLSVMLCSILFFLVNIKKKTIFKYLILILTIIILFFVFYFVLGHQINDIPIIQKLNRLSERGDFSNGRTKMWKIIWDNSSLFQTEKVYQKAVPHNVFFGLMNDYGKINAFFYFFFMISLFIKSFLFALRNKKDFRLLPLVTVTSFLCICLFENMLMTLPMVFMYISIPILVNND